MKEATIFNTNEFMAKAQNLLKAAADAPIKRYTSLNGVEYAECPGAYNDQMVRSMCHDMTQTWISYRNTPLEEKVQGWMPKMTVFNTEVNRMIDDLNGDRPVKAQKLKKWNRLRAEIHEALRSPDINNSYITDIPERMLAWDDRLAYQLSWIYFLRENYHMNYFEKQLGWTEEGSGKSPMTGLTPAEEEQVRSIIKVRRMMLDTYLKIPVNTPEHKECLSKLGNLARAMDTILDHAADDFAEEDKKGNNTNTKPIETADETDEKDLADVLTAIKVISDKIQSKVVGKAAQDVPLKDKVVTGRVLLSRFEEKLGGAKDVPPEMSKGIVGALRDLADDIEMAHMLS